MHEQIVSLILLGIILAGCLFDRLRQHKEAKELQERYATFMNNQDLMINSLLHLVNKPPTFNSTTPEPQQKVQSPADTSNNPSTFEV